MTRDTYKTLPAALAKRPGAAVARSMRQAHRHVVQALRKAGMQRFRVKALVTGIQYTDPNRILHIGLFDSGDEGKRHWVFKAQVAEPVRNALEEAIGGPLGQPYLAATIIADIQLGLTDEFMLTATITNLIELRPYRDF